MPKDPRKPSVVAAMLPRELMWSKILTLKDGSEASSSHSKEIPYRARSKDLISLMNYDYQSLVSFQDAKGVSQYRPEDIRSFSFFDDKNSAVTLQAVSSPDGTGLAFLRLYYSGVCKVYGITKIEVSAVPGSRDEPAQPSFIRNERKFLQVSNSQFYPLKRAGFKKNMREVFAAYPRIVAGLDSKQYTYDKWEDLVKDYNSGTHEEMSASK